MADHIKRFRCLSCQREVIANNETHEIAHEAPECDWFRSAVAAHGASEGRPVIVDDHGESIELSDASATTEKRLTGAEADMLRKLLRTSQWDDTADIDPDRLAETWIAPSGHVIYFSPAPDGQFVVIYVDTRSTDALTFNEAVARVRAGLRS
jgi:hypothetical protein